MPRPSIFALALALAACGGGRASGALETEPRASGAEAPAGDDRDAPPAREPRDEADSLLLTGRYDDALALLASLERDERVVRAMARAHLRRGRVDEAIVLLRAEPSPSLAVSADLGEALVLRGREAEAREHLVRPIEAYNRDEIAADDADGLLAVARAARALGSPKDANVAFREASRARPGDPEVELAWARLFLDAHAPEEAARAVGIVLERVPDHPDALALLAEARLDAGAPLGLAKDAALRALETNPSHVGARVFLAELALRHRDVETAARELSLAEEVNPNDLDLLSARAAMAWLLDRHDELARIERRVKALHPAYGAMYEAIAELAEYGHRYAEGVALADAALELTPRDPRALARRGINLLRLAREREGRRDLEAAFRRDPFDVRVFNTLELYERTIDREYELFERGPFTFRMHRAERPVLERHVPALVEEARRAMAARYAFEPARPIQIELYAEADDFAVRTSGLPGLGLQGVCFGHVVTAVSPRAGPFNWGQILWHEMAHVFHLQLSRSRVPRWLTEGLAEHESERSPHGFVREMDHDVASMLRAGRVPSFSDFDAVFFSARTSSELVGAYAIAAEAAAFLDERFGSRRIREILVRLGEGAAFSELVPEVLGLGVSDLDDAFGAHLKTKLARFEGRFLPPRVESVEAAARAAKEAPRDASAAARLAEALLRAGEREKARGAAERALALDPRSAEALFVMARLDLGGAPLDAAARLERMIEIADGVEPRLVLAAIRTNQGRPDEAARVLRGAAAIDPRRRAPWDALRDLARRADDARAEREALEHITELEIHAREPHLALLASLLAAGDHARLAEAAERAVFVSPHDPRVHEARLLAWSALGDEARALRALDDLSLTAERAPDEAMRRAAEALEEAGRRRAAREIRRRISSAAARP